MAWKTALAIAAETPMAPSSLIPIGAERAGVRVVIRNEGDVDIADVGVTGK